MSEKPNDNTTEKPNNPKDKMGALKLDPTLIPTSAMIGVMECMANGAKKYDPYNWRDPNKKIGVVAYVGAAIRHAWSYLDGEDLAPDSGLHHIDHAISGLLVLRDAQRNGYAIDNRPVKGCFGKEIEDHFQANKTDNSFKPEKFFYELPTIDLNVTNASARPKWARVQIKPTWTVPMGCGFTVNQHTGEYEYVNNDITGEFTLVPKDK